MAQSRVACALAGAALSVLVLTGCAGGDPGAAQTPPASRSALAAPSVSEAPSATPMPTPTPSPASAAGPAVNIPVPEKPALADENSVEGLEAFTEWWFELLNYAYATNDLEPLKAVTDEGCGTCENMKQSIQDAYVDGGWQVGGDVRLTSFGSKFEPNVHGSVIAFVQSTQSSIAIYGGGGDLVVEYEEQTEPATSQLVGFHSNGHWSLLDLGTPNADNA